MRRRCGSSDARRCGSKNLRRRVLSQGGLIRRCLMRETLLFILLSLALASRASAQSTLRLTVDDAVKMALDHNSDLRADRLDPQISDTRVAAAAGAFRPTFNTSLQRNNQLLPPAGFLTPTATHNDVVSSNAGLSQKLP